MADPNALLHDPRRRNLAVLAIVAAIAVALAGLALWHQASLVAPRYTPQAFFPDLPAHNREIARIHIVSKTFGALDVAFKPSAGWVLPAQSDYPADFSQVRSTIVGMAGLETIAPETRRADWLHYLDLEAPDKSANAQGGGIEITLLNDKNQVIASMIAGKTKDIGEPGGATGLFVRKPDSDQSWLVRSVFTPSADPKDWMKKDIVGIDRARIQEADVSPPSGPGYVVRRDKPSDTDFTLVKLPKGRELAYPTAPDGPAAAIVGFTFNDVAPAQTLDFGHAAQLVTKTFDGLVVTADIVKHNEVYWVRLEASAEKPAAKDEARKINKAAEGWAFQVPGYKGAQFTTELDSLLKPVDGKAK